uniref:C45 family peptidase n=1 Tax=uncultured Draconibacterium sp. TaxID=1573823 RepID=UPI00321702CD
MALKFEEFNLHEKQGDYSHVKHLRLQGTNYEIGNKLGELAKHRHLLQMPKWSTTTKRDAQYVYFKKNYPAHFDRMAGFANAFGEDIRSAEYDYSCFGATLSFPMCSAVYYPPGFTETESGIISRNADLPLVCFPQVWGETVQKGRTKIMEKPYVLELHPETGYSSLVMFCFELYGLALDGINSEGLAVTHLHADVLNEEKYMPGMDSGVGINEMLVVQLLLDTCKTVDEAKEVLLCNKHFRMILPTHLLIADKYGNSFIWEYPIEHNQDFFIDGNSEIQVITNFPVHKYPEMYTFPESNDLSCPFARYKTLREAINACNGKVSQRTMKEINSQVFVCNEMYKIPPPVAVRTIYHNLYDCNQKSMEVSFYRKEADNKQKRTAYFKIELR